MPECKNPRLSSCLDACQVDTVPLSRFEILHFLGMLLPMLTIGFLTMLSSQRVKVSTKHNIQSLLMLTNHRSDIII